jgi:hypothetical protein
MNRFTTTALAMLFMGLVPAVQHAPIPADHNAVDGGELIQEIFRYELIRSTPSQDSLSLQGMFKLDPTDGDDIAEVIEAAVAGLNVIHRRFARGHLQRTIRAYGTVSIHQGEATITIATDGGEPVRAPASGEPVEWTREDGERIRVSISRENCAIRQTFTTRDEEREYLFRPDADGQGMILSATVRIDRLDDPIRYELVYRQESTGDPPTSAEQGRQQP